MYLNHLYESQSHREILKELNLPSIGRIVPHKIISIYKTDINVYPHAQSWSATSHEHAFRLSPGK